MKPTTPNGTAACFGTRCSRHSSCTHYHGVETPDRRRFIGTCRTPAGAYPLFEPRQAVPAASVVDGEGDTCD
jgi:hypothetical protein